MKAVEVFVSGQVQGVGFRAFVERAAGDLGVRGWVRNLTDGRVHAWLEGEDGAVDAAVQACGRGPASSRVQGLETRQVEPARVEGFEQKPTASPP